MTPVNYIIFVLAFLFQNFLKSAKVFMQNDIHTQLITYYIYGDVP